MCRARKTTEIGNPKRAHASKMSNLYPSIMLLGLAALLPSLVVAGSCREAQLCCNGRDSSCVVQKAPINAIIEDLSDKPCYCDHACLKLGDCCDDFKDHCGGECKDYIILLPSKFPILSNINAKIVFILNCMLIYTDFPCTY